MKPLSLIDKAFFLKRTLPFAMLDLELLLTIADKLAVSSFDKGDLIFNCDQDAHKLYLIAKGSVKIRDAQKHTLAVLKSDEIFGDEALFNDKSRSYEAICETDATLLTLSRTNLLTIISECPSVAIGFLKAYSSVSSFRQR